MGLVTMTSYWNRVGPNPVTNVLIRRSCEKDRQTGKRQSLEGGGHSQGTAGIVSHKQEQDEVRKDPPLEPSEGAWPSQHLDFGLLASTLQGNKFLLFEAFQSMVICNNRSRTLITAPGLAPAPGDT